MRLLISAVASTVAFGSLAAENPISRLGLADGWYCSPTGENVLVSAKESRPFIGIDGLDCHDPVVANGRLTAKTCYANGGIKLAVEKRFVAQGEALIMDGVTYKLTPREKGADVCAGILKAVIQEEPEPVMTAGHNGSGMQIGMDDKIIYVTPKASIRDVVKSGTVLVEGRWIGERYEGIAYAFKKGCAPAPYKVSGAKVEKPGRLDLVLTGAGPIRQGCEVTGYSATSPHSRLVFDRLMSN